MKATRKVSVKMGYSQGEGNKVSVTIGYSE